MAQHRVLIGMNYPGPDGEERRAEIGDVIDDFPADKAETYVTLGVLELVTERTTPAIAEGDWNAALEDAGRG